MAHWLKSKLIVAAAIGAVVLPGATAAQASVNEATIPTERFVELPLKDGEHVDILVVRPNHPRGAIVMLPGGSGDIGLSRDANPRHGDNFVVRTRKLWAAHGYAVLIPDTIDRANLRGERSTPRYAGIVNDIVSFAHAQSFGPIFLLGTSQGSIAATNGAAHASAGSLAGVVLTESVSVMGGSHETVFDSAPQDVRAPVLIVANRDDKCTVAPPEMASRIAAAMRGSRDVRVLAVSGGTKRSDNDCGSLTPHGYFGMEDNVVNAISKWMDARL
ncbi:hypothetical protein BH09PSE3_BH09PSE3_18360 [soil metagenome]